MATMRCKECNNLIGEAHWGFCSLNNPPIASLVKNEDCSTEQMIAESIEVEDSQTGPSELSLDLSDHLHFEDKL